MARIRSIKPEFWSSPGVETLDPFARLLYIAMWNWADDNGVGVANARELAGFAFPLDEDVTLVDLRRWLVDLRRVFDVMFYTVAGRAYYAIPSWENHQKFDRRSSGKYPGPERADTPSDLQECTDSAETHEYTSSTRRDSVAGTGEQGNRGTGEELPSSALVPHDDPEEIRADVDALCNRLASRIEANGAKRPTIGKKWHDSARLMLDNDGHTYDQIAWLIDWSQADEFWRSNILSMPKLREKFDQLKLKSTASSDARPRHQQETDDWYASALVRAQDAERNAS